MRLLLLPIWSLTLMLFLLVLPGSSFGQSLVDASGELTSDLRTWTSSSGKFSVEAKLLSAEDETIKLEKKDGRVITLPSSKLCDADREFIERLRKQMAQEDNPFAGGEPSANTKKSRSKKPASRTRAETQTFKVNVLSQRREIRGGQWKVAMGTTVDSSNRDPLPQKPISVAGFGGRYGFHDRRQAPVVDLAGRWAAIKIWNAFEKKTILSVVDLKKGKPLESAVVPEKELKVFAIDGDSETLVTLVEESGRTPGRLEFRSFQALDDPAAVWETATFFDNDGFKPRLGYFTSPNRLLTIGDNLALWDVAKAKPVYSLKLGRRQVESEQVSFSDDRKMIAVAHQQSVQLFDVENGKLQGTIERGSTARAISVSPTGAYLAGLESSGHVWIWDLAANELAQEFHTDAHRNLVWVDDRYLLGDHRFLVDVEYRVCVWQYTHQGRDEVVPLHAGHFLLQRDDTLHGIKLPHHDLTGRMDELDPDQLLLLRPGDEFAIDFDLPFDADEQQQIRESLEQRLATSGFSVNNKSDLVLKGRVIAEKRKKVQVRSFGFGRSTESMSVQANRCVIEILKNGDSIWKASRYHGPSMVIHHLDNETLQEYADRTSKPTPGLFLSFQIPTGLSALPGGKPLGRSELIAAGSR